MSRVHPETMTAVCAPLDTPEGKENALGPANPTTPAKRNGSGPQPPTTGPEPLHTIPDPLFLQKDRFDGLNGDRAPRQHVRAWKMLGRAALLARAMNPRDDIIDIYHDSIEGGSRFMIHPNSKFRRIWDVLTALGVLYVCVKVPLAIGYNYIDWSSFSVIDTLVDVYFIVDMVVTMRTGIFSNGAVVMDSKVVLRRYLRSWFIIDIISNFPLALFVDNSARKSIKMVKLQKLPKLLRLGRLLKYLREYAKYYNLALSFVAMSMGLHFFACLWASLFNNCYNSNGDPICGRSMMGRMYIQSVHIILLMFLGISENTTFSSISALVDPHEDATIELYIMSVVIFLLGLIFSSFFFGNVLALIISWDQQNAQFRNRMDIIAAEMRYYELPDELQHRVRRNYDYLWINQRAYSDMMLLNQPGISKTLRTTIALHLYKDLVKTVPFFAGSDARFLGKVCLALETAVYLPGDTIIYYDDIGKEMFIVRKGLVEIIIPEADNTEKRVYLRDGNFFGETALVIDVRRTNTVKAVNICDLNVLSKSAFNEIVAEYPEFGERMKRTVIKRQLDNMNIQSPTEKMKIQNQLNMVVEKSLKERRMSVSLRTIYRAKKLGDKLKEIADRAAKSNQVRRLSRRLSRSVSATAGTLPASNRQPSLRGRQPAPSSSKSSQNVTIDRSFASPHPAHRNGDPGGQRVGDKSAQPTALATLNSQTAAQMPMLNHNDSPTPSTRRLQIDAVSRKLSKAEISMDLIPMALMELSGMVNQIKRTTDRLNRRLQQHSDVSSDEDDLDCEDYQSQLDVATEDPLLATASRITPLVEESEEELARRESRSVFTPPTPTGSDAARNSPHQ